MMDNYKLRVLQVGERDDIGRRFNGHDVHINLKKRNIQSQHFVWLKEGDDPDTHSLFTRHKLRSLNDRMTFYETKHSIQSLLYPSSFSLLCRRPFWRADIVHYHILHNQYFSLLALPLLSVARPSVWTIHDPWALTGHCIWPYDCDLWQSGCAECPNLNMPFAMNVDRAHTMWAIKKWVYRTSPIDLIVSSRIMENMVKQSPLTQGMRVHRIPFGIDLTVFKPQDSVVAKRKLGIPEENFVITFRASGNLFKGLVYIKDILHRLNEKQKVTLIGFQADPHLLDEFKHKFQVIEYLGWMGDLERTILSYNATDVFLMPSIKESFGMMAIEAMACGKPVIAFEGTALNDTLIADRGGGVVVKKSSEALLDALVDLMKNEGYRLQQGQRARRLAEEEYDIKDHISRLLQIYSDKIDRRKFWLI